MQTGQSEDLQMQDGCLKVKVVPEVDGTALLESVQSELQSNKVERLALSLKDENWDSYSLSVGWQISQLAKQNGIEVDLSAMPKSAAQMLALARPTNRSDDESEPGEKDGFFERLGLTTINAYDSMQSSARFVGDSASAGWRFTRGKAEYQRSDFIHFLRMAGPQSVAIVGLVNLLLGVILAFIGALQLQQFGAQIYVANLVAVGLCREIAPMMTGIVVAGRVGAAFAAQLGTMKVNEELDAFRTFGFSTFEFLVLPRMMALILMMPLLVLYADAIGMFGGFLIGTVALGVGQVEYYEQTKTAIDMLDVGLGVLKGAVFGALVAITGCRAGMNAGSDASSVGEAATAAVVNGIIAIIVASAVFAVLTNALGI